MPDGRLAETVTVKPHPGGVRGAMMSLDEVARRAWSSRNDPRVRAWALKAIREGGNPTSVRGKVAAIVDAYRARVRYMPDPVGTEFIAGPVQVLCLDDHGLCLLGADCDEATVTCLACALSVGIAGQVVGASYRDPVDQPTHVYFRVTDERGEPVPADATTSHPVGTVSPSRRTWIVDPDRGVGAAGLPGGDFVGVGRPGAVDKLERWDESELAGVTLGGRGLAGFDLGNPILVTPGDVIAYRQTWDAYILAVVKAFQDCGAAWTAASQNQTPATPIATSQFATTPDATTLALWGKGYSIDADSILTSWNAYAGFTDAQIVLLAPDILRYYQALVLRVGRDYLPRIQNDCPQLPLPTPPGFDVQAQVIGRIEGLGILAHGVLELIGTTASGTLDTFGAIATKAAGAASSLANVLSTPWPWIAITVVAGGFLVWRFVPARR